MNEPTVRPKLRPRAVQGSGEAGKSYPATKAKSHTKPGRRSTSDSCFARRPVAMREEENTGKSNQGICLFNLGGGRITQVQRDPSPPHSHISCIAALRIAVG